MQNAERGCFSCVCRNSFRVAMLCATLAFLLPTSFCRAIVLHDPEDAPSQSERPDDNVLGRWSTSGSCVVIGREDWDTTGYVLTTRHQGGSVGTPVWIGDEEYVVAAQYTTGDVDLRFCRLDNIPENGGGKANLTDFVLLNENTDEKNKGIVLGGYGKTKGAEGSDPAGSFYYWTGSSTEDNLHWGRNTIDDTEDDFQAGSRVSDVLVDDFDGKSTTDAAIAEWDSGGGWFYQDDGDWLVAGLSAYAINGKSYFDATGEWDFNRAVRVSSYATGILSWMGEHYEPSIPGDANLDNDVDLDDLGILADNWNSTTATWYTGDFDFDSDVDLDDLGILADHWGDGVSSGIPVQPLNELFPALLPEPTSLCLLGLGALTLIQRSSGRLKRRNLFKP